MARGYAILYTARYVPGRKQFGADPINIKEVMFADPSSQIPPVVQVRIAGFMKQNPVACRGRPRAAPCQRLTQWIE